MCYRCQCSLHHIYASWDSNDDIQQSSNFFSNDDICSLLGVAREKVGNLPLNMCSTFQNNSHDNISKCIMGYCTFTSIGALKQMGTKTQGMDRNSK
jgi:hypothetical protein